MTAYVLQNSITKEFIGLCARNGGRPTLKLTKKAPRLYTDYRYAEQAMLQIKDYNNLEIKEVNLEVL